MIYYNSTANTIDPTRVIQNIVNKVSNALSNSGIQGYDLRCTKIDIPTMSISFEITHIGYPVEILFYNGTVFKRDSLFTVDYKSVIEMIKDGSLTPQQKEDAVDKQIETLNTSTAEMIYDQIKTRQVLKSFEKIVHDKYVVSKNFPSPEKMWEEFKAFYEAVKSIPSPIPFPCTIDDWWNYLEKTIKKNTAFWHACDDIEVRNMYNIKSYRYADFFTVYYDLEEYYSSDYRKSIDIAIDTAIAKSDRTTDIDKIVKSADCNITSFFNELNGIPAIIQSSIPTAQPAAV
jgi:hypothetical protein